MAATPMPNIDVESIEVPELLEKEPFATWEFRAGVVAYVAYLIRVNKHFLPRRKGENYVLFRHIVRALAANIPAPPSPNPKHPYWAHMIIQAAQVIFDTEVDKK